MGFAIMAEAAEAHKSSLNYTRSSYVDLHQLLPHND